MTPERYLRIKELFQEASERPPEERGEYLAAETGDDRGLRDEVEAMLRHAGTRLLESPAWEGLRMERKLDRGAQLGPYEILQEAGAGGMGRVYKALDTRLGRTVAIKVLSAEFSDRLRLEARAISALNHPHVCALYDIGNQDGMAYLVMEYVEGESLATRLARGPLPVADAVRYGVEIASGLAAAHAQGIVHRDLKPANIMITASGAKVLDFGVAQIGQDGETAPGGVAGTVAYMSPSQLNGNPAEARTDVFALGLVLSEMVTGTRRRTRLDHLPAELAGLIERCLQQDSGSRVQRMEDVQSVLERLRAKPSIGPRRWWKAAAGAATVLGAAAALFVMRTPVTAPPTVRVERPAAPVLALPDKPARRVPIAVPPPEPVVPPSLVTLAAYPGTERDPSFSPDGSKVAFSWHNGARSGYGIYVKRVKSAEAPEQLTDQGAEDWGPAWSADGRKIAFRRKAARSGIYVVPTGGGTANLLASIGRQLQETLPQMSWSPDGKWIASPDRDASGATQIYLFSTATGEKRQITSNSGGTDHAPAFSSNGKALAYASCSAAVEQCDVFVAVLGRDMTATDYRRITDQRVYVRGLAWMPDGRSIVYSAGRRATAETYLWRVAVSPPGTPERIDMAGSQARHPAVSPAGGLLAYTRLDRWNLMMIRNFR
jgi:serine/threonine protein kinase/Tol biopolymer transport system component